MIGIFLVPVSNIEAKVTNLTLSLNSADIGITSVKVHVNIVGTLDPGQQLLLTLKTQWNTLYTTSFLPGANPADTIVTVPASLTDPNASFDPSTEYEIVVYDNTPAPNIVQSNQVSFKGQDTNQNSGGVGSDPSNPVYQDSNVWECTAWPPTWFRGCITTFVFYVIWTPIAALTTVAARILDFFIYYSISSQAYTNGFIDKAWATVRDISNIFFIIALLYIAFKTVLDMGGHNKKLIGNIIIFALLINFSLFATKVVIDVSNVLTMVFYAQIDAVNNKGQPLDTNNEEKSITVGLVKQFDPQKITEIKTDRGAVMAIMFIEIAIMFYMIKMFLSVAILFIGRVVTLWIVMIFSPIAFMSYALPFNIPGFGHSKWWDELSKSAFLAPIFVFFLYIIILFGGFLKDLDYSGDAGNWYEKLLPVIIPFAIIYILLTKAKDLAVEYSGDMGKSVTSAIQTAGGLALGVASAGTAYLGTRAIGGFASSQMAKRGEDLREQAKKKGLAGLSARMQLKTFDKATKGSFDFRQSAPGKFVQKQSGMDFSASSIGAVPKDGGFKGAQKRRAEEIEKEKEIYKTTMSDDDVKLWSQKRLKQYNEQKEGALNQEEFEKEYIKKHGEIPRLYSSAQELNTTRMEAFKNNLSTNTLLGALAYESVKRNLTDENNYEKSDMYWSRHKEKSRKKAQIKLGKNFKDEEFNKNYDAKLPGYYDNEGKFDKEIAKAVNEVKIGRAKLLIGGLGVLATGGIGGAVAGAIGGGGVIAGTATGLFAGAPAAASIFGAQEFGESISGVESGAEKMVAKNLEKEIKQTSSTTARLEKAKERLQEHKDAILTAYNEADGASYMEVKKTKDADGKEVPEKDDKENVIVEKINNTKLEEVIARQVNESADLSSQIGALNNTIRGLKDSGKETTAQEFEKEGLLARKTTIDLKLAKLNNLKGINEKIANTEKEIADITAGGGSTTKPAEKKEKPATTEKHEEKHEEKESAHPPKTENKKEEHHH